MKPASPFRTPDGFFPDEEYRLKAAVRAAHKARVRSLRRWSTATAASLILAAGIYGVSRWLTPAIPPSPGDTPVYSSGNDGLHRPSNDGNYWTRFAEADIFLELYE